MPELKLKKTSLMSWRMIKVNISLTCNSVETGSYDSRLISVDLKGVSIREIVEAVGDDRLLDYIGKELALKYFDVDEVVEATKELVSHSKEVGGMFWHGHSLERADMALKALEKK